jgi:hypothetical protein
MPSWDAFFPFSKFFPNQRGRESAMRQRLPSMKAKQAPIALDGPRFRFIHYEKLFQASGYNLKREDVLVKATFTHPDDTNSRKWSQVCGKANSAHSLPIH